MPTCIAKIKNKYFEWSTIVDAPVTYGMSLEQFKEYYKHQYGQSGMDKLEDRLKRVEKTGTYFHDGMTVRELLQGNRAGPDEKCATEDEILDQYDYKTAH